MAKDWSQDPYWAPILAAADEAEDKDLFWRRWACSQCPDPCDSLKPWPCVRGDA